MKSTYPFAPSAGLRPPLACAKEQMQLAIHSIPAPDHLTHDGVAFPLMLECTTADATLADVREWITAQRNDIAEQLATYGAILFRAFPLVTADDFDAFITAFEYPNFLYRESLSNAVRVNRTERVFTANEAPSDVAILLHHEMAQTPIAPSKLFFFCEQPAESGGATPICRSDVLFQRLLAECPQFAHDCATKGLKYTNVMPAADDPKSGMGRSWQSTLRAETRSEAETRLRDLSYTWTWLPDGSLRATTPVLPAVKEVAPGRKAFFNQLIAASHGWKDTRNDPSQALTFGDGTPLPIEDVLQAATLAESLTYNIPWQTGDVALLDNHLAMHGRRPFEGRRAVLASLAS